MNADAEVMEYFPAPLSADESNAFVDRIEAHFDEHDFGLWAVEVIDSASFAGYIGLWPASFESHFTPAIEIGWRLDRAFWGQSYAPEGATRVMEDGFGRLGLDEIVSFTATTNLRSRRVMEKLGMTHDPAEDFDHPSVAVGDPLRRHVLYRMPATAWLR